VKKILSISDAAALALHTMALLASQPERVFPVCEIAAALNGASENHLSKVLQRLARDGFVRSVRGPAGGFKIAPNQQKQTLLSIFESIEGTFKPDDCLLGIPACGRGKCILGNLLRSINDQFKNALKSARLSDLSPAFSISNINSNKRGKRK